MRIVFFEDPRTRYSFELRPPSRTNNTCCKRTSVLQYAHAHYTANQPRSLTRTLGYHYRTHAYAYANSPRMFAPQRPPIYTHSIRASSYTYTCPQPICSRDPRRQSISEFTNTPCQRNAQGTSRTHRNTELITNQPAGPCLPHLRAKRFEIATQLHATNYSSGTLFFRIGSRAIALGTLFLHCFLQLFKLARNTSTFYASAHMRSR